MNCNIDYIFINTNKISNDDINISDEDINNYYNENKEENYSTPETRIGTKRKSLSPSKEAELPNNPSVKEAPFCNVIS